MKLFIYCFDLLRLRPDHDIRAIAGVFAFEAFQNLFDIDDFFGIHCGHAVVGNHNQIGLRAHPDLFQPLNQQSQHAVEPLDRLVGLRGIRAEVMSLGVGLMKIKGDEVRAFCRWQLQPAQHPGDAFLVGAVVLV